MFHLRLVSVSGFLARSATRLIMIHWGSAGAAKSMQLMLIQCSECLSEDAQLRSPQWELVQLPKLLKG